MKPTPKCSLFNSLSSDMVTNMALAKAYALPSGLYACMCYQLFSKTTGPNCMKFSGMICHHPRTNRLDFVSDQVKVKITKRSKTTGLNCMKLSGMIYHHTKTNQLDFVSDQVKGQGPGHEKVKNVFLS